MEKKILDKITSKYILKTIFFYIKDIKFPFKLFIHSNLFQNKLELNYYDYQKKYFDNLGINFFDYIYFDFSRPYKFFDKDILKKNLNEKLLQLKIGKDVINKYAINFFRNYCLKYRNETEEFIIDIFSPFFDIISETEFFDNIFTIPIKIDVIEKYNLKKDYISLFEKMNNSNSNYASLFFEYIDNNDIKYLNEFKINIKQIKRMTINQKQDTLINNYDNFYTSLFSLKNIENLVYLNLSIGDKWIKIKSEIFINLNKIKSLKELHLNSFNFETTFILNLMNLEKIYLKNCTNLTFSQESCFNIKKLKLFGCKIDSSKYLLQLPNLEECILQDDLLHSNQLYNLIIDFSSLKKLKFLEAEKYDFINLGDSCLEKVILYSKPCFYKSDENNVERKMIEKLISINTLKDINIILRKINDNEVLTIKGENKSVTDMTINFKTKKDCIIYNLQSKFINLRNIIIKSGYNNKYDSNETNIEIKQNPICNIKELTLDFKDGRDIKFYIHSFENLVKINIKLSNIINNKEKIFPFLNNKCHLIFQNLITFNFIYYNNCYWGGIGRNCLNNILNNLNKMPNLKEFTLYSEECRDPYNKEEYETFINKILLLKLDYIVLWIKTSDVSNEYNEKYSEFELKKICSSFENFDSNKIKINKM